MNVAFRKALMATDGFEQIELQLLKIGKILMPSGSRA